MMHPSIKDLMSRYQSSPLKKKDILREILQQSALLSLERHNFFEHAAFYGGTALRILYGLDRFSEDLDFSLLKPNKQFDFKPFLQGLSNEMHSLGFHVDIGTKKTKPPILSAFVKSNTMKLLLKIEEETPHKKLHPEEKISIKLEIDTDPPSGFNVEHKLILNPSPFYVLTYCPSDLFAGKMHALLCRNWKTRIKGRDWYDLIWFITKEISVHLSHLEGRMHQSGHLPLNEHLDHEALIHLLEKKIKTIDWKLAKEDVRVFLYDPTVLDIWSEQFFLDLIEHLKSS